MGYRKCSKHGWLETNEYTVDASGQTICPACETATTGFQMETPRGYSPKPAVRDAGRVYMARRDAEEGR